jgi:hypothetical protein
MCLSFNKRPAGEEAARSGNEYHEQFGRFLWYSTTNTGATSFTNTTVVIIRHEHNFSFLNSVGSRNQLDYFQMR